MTGMSRTSLGHVLLLHGFTGSARSLAALARGLEATGFETTAMDLPGHGANPELLTPEGLVRQAKEACTRLPEPAFVVGHSLGARVAMLLPARAVVALSPPAPGCPPLGGIKVREFRYVRPNDPGTLATVLSHLDEQPLSLVPTLLLWGERDFPESKAAPEAWRGLHPYLTAEELPGLDHWRLPSDPGATARVVAWLGQQAL